MANIATAAAAAAAAAAANRDPAVDRSLRSVFGEFVKVTLPGVGGFIRYVPDRAINRLEINVSLLALVAG